MSSFDLTTPPLTVELKKILSGYPLGGQIIKELIQNAEDSGATKVKFYVDYTEYPRLTLLDPGLDKFQGPALLSYNNQTFAEEDFTSLISIRRSEKANKPLKIGKFGLGFNSVYHLTDLPSLRTGKSVVFLDPHEKYFRRYDCRTGIKFDLSDSKFDSFPDQFEPLMNKMDGQPNRYEPFDGTLFRFPIRNEKAACVSDLCNDYKNARELVENDVLAPFLEDFHLILLFLRNIESIEVYKIDGNGEELIASTGIDMDKSDNDLLHKRTEYKAYLSRTVNADKTMNEKMFELDDYASTWKFTISTKQLANGEWIARNDAYIMSNYVGLKSMSDSLRAVAFETYTMPLCNVAYKYNANNEEPFRMHCFLPLPETLVSGLDLFVNGTFSLTDNRRDLKWSDRDTRNDSTYIWNEYLSTEILTKTVQHLLIHAKGFVNCDLTVYEYYRIFPDLAKLNEQLRHCMADLFQSLCNLDVIVTVQNEWLKIGNVLFANDFVNKYANEESGSIVETVLGLFANIASLDIPDHVHRFYSNQDQTMVNHLDWHIVLDKLRSPDTMSRFTVEQKTALLNLILVNSESCGDLNGIELLPVMDGSWTKYSNTSAEWVVVFGNRADATMFQDCVRLQHRVVKCDGLGDETRAKLDGLLRKQTRFYQIKFFDDNMFLTFANAIEYTALDRGIQGQIWTYIYQNFNQNLKAFECLRFISLDNNNQCLQLKQKDVKYYYYKDTWNAPDIIGFVMANGFQPSTLSGCVLFEFDKLPYGLRNHPQMADYFEQLKPENLIECLELIEKHAGSVVFSTLAQDEMTAECKQAVLNELMRLKPTSQTQNMFIRNRLPIFQVFGSKQNTSAIDCALYATPARMHTTKDRFSAFCETSMALVGIKMVDCQDERVFLYAKSIGLVEYPIDTLVINIVQVLIEQNNNVQLFDLLTLIFSNQDLIGNLQIKTGLLNKPIVNCVSRVCEFYDPSNAFIRHIVPVEHHLAAQFTTEPFFSVMQAHLINRIDGKFIDNYLQRISLHGQDANILLDYLTANINNTDKLDLLGTTLNANPWLMSDSIIPDKRDFYRPNELYTPDMAIYVKYTKPIVTNTVDTKLYKILGIRNAVSLDDVVNDYCHQVANNIVDVQMLDTCYGYFAKHDPKQVVQSIRTRVQGNQAFIFDGKDGFYAHSELVLQSPILLMPYMYALQDDRLHKLQYQFVDKHKDFYLKAFEIKQSIDFTFLLNVLYRIKDDPTGQMIDTDLVLKILDFISNMNLTDVDLKGVVLPIQLPSCGAGDGIEAGCRFEVRDKCVFDHEVDDDLDIEQDLSEKISIANKKGYKLCIPAIPIATLKRLGLRSYNEKCFDAIKKFEQREDLLMRLRKLLDGYTKGTIFNEMIQNADDAKATRIEFCIDLNESRQWKSRQPMQSLWIYNNSVFSESDFGNLELLGSENKMQKQDTIGKFGVGFNSVYNITDCPSILSRESLVILNPTKECFKNSTGMRINYIENSVDGNRLLNECLQPHDGLFGFSIAKSKCKTAFDGTIIRLPLRLEPSLLSSHVFNDESEIKDLIRNFYLMAHDTILFTQNLVEIKVSLRRQGSNGPTSIFSCIKSPLTYIRQHNIQIDSNPYATDLVFSKQSNILTAASKSGNALTLSTSMVLQTTVDYNNIDNYFGVDTSEEVNAKTWLLTAYFTRESTLNLDKFQNDKRLISGFMPLAGAAVELLQCTSTICKPFKLCEKFENNSLYCFLPTGIKTGLCVHVNGCFRLTEDRKHLLYESSSANVISQDLKEQWNELILVPLVKALFVLIEDVLKTVDYVDYKLFVSKLWPINQANAYFQRFETLFYELICSSDAYCVFTDESKGFYPFSRSYFIDYELLDDNENSGVGRLIATFLNNDIQTRYGCHLIDLPIPVRQKIKTISKCTERFIGDQRALELIILNKDTMDRFVYNRFLSYYILKCSIANGSELTQIGKVIQQNDCIESCNGSLKRIGDMFKPCEDFRVVFDQDEGRFVSNFISANRMLNDVVERMGLQTVIGVDLLIEKAKSISLLSQTDFNKAKKRSQTLVKLMGNLDQGQIKTLMDVDFVFCKPRPRNWPSNMYKGDDDCRTPLKPKQVYGAQYEALIGCVQPIFDQMAYNYNRTMSIETVEQSTLIGFIVDQLLNIHVEINDTTPFKEPEAQKFYLNAYKHFADYLADISDQVTLATFRNRLPSNFIFISDSKQKLFKSDSVVRKLHNKIEPFMMQVPEIYATLAGFLAKMGVQEAFTYDQLKQKMSDMKTKFGEDQLDDVHFKATVHIANEMIAVLERNPQSAACCKDVDLYLPDTRQIMRSITTLFYSLGSKETQFLVNDDNDDNTDMFVLNDRIASRPFAIPDFDSKYLLSIGEPFGQVEKLTRRIANILERYNNEMDIFKEFIQNADDAGAHEIRFILDMRRHGNKNIFSKEFDGIQGPALCCWNDAIFSENDFSGIKSLGEGSKYDSLEKIGRFGVGFNTAYHFTDAPQFISNNSDYVIFDPQCKYFTQIQPTNPGCRIKNAKKRLSAYTDVMAAFNYMELDDRTMFRFALRTEPSDISKRCWRPYEIAELFGKIKTEVSDMIIFLRHVKKIGFYKIDDKTTQEDMVRLYEIEITMPNDDEARRAVGFYGKLNAELRCKTSQNKVDLPFEQCTYKIERLLRDPFEDHCESFQICAQTGFETKPTAQAISSNGPLLNKYYPFGSVAYDLNRLKHEGKKDAYRIFCYLPLYQHSPLNCHVNGMFALDHENRRVLYNSSSLASAASVDKDKEEFSTTWNKCLIDLVICPLYVLLVDTIRREFVVNIKDPSFNAFQVLC